jgi:hypothetical protein
MYIMTTGYLLPEGNIQGGGQAIKVDFTRCARPAVAAERDTYQRRYGPHTKSKISPTTHTP